MVDTGLGTGTLLLGLAPAEESRGCCVVNRHRSGSSVRFPQAGQRWLASFCNGKCRSSVLGRLCTGGRHMPVWQSGRGHGSEVFDGDEHHHWGRIGLDGMYGMAATARTGERADQ
ncbi:hypothetical protein B7463_g3119, partial [Scytalidium lignicola]